MKLMHVAMPHCGMAADSTSGGEVAERETYTHLYPAGIRAHVFGPMYPGLRWWNSLLHFRERLRRCCLDHAPPVIRAHSLRYTGLPALWAGWRYGIPVSAHYHHLEQDRLAWLDRFVIRHADQVTTDSYFSLDQAFHINPAIQVVRLGVAHHVFTPTPRPDGRIVLLVGGTKARKNTAFVHRIWDDVRARVPGAILLEFGEGLAVPDETLPLYYQSARAVAMPSRLEGFGLPVLEAMASARPVVCSDQGALPEFGIETTPLVPELWIDRLARLLTDDAQWAKESEENRARAQAYSWQKTAQHLARLWHGLGHS